MIDIMSNQIGQSDTSQKELFRRVHGKPVQSGRLKSNLSTFKILIGRALFLVIFGFLSIAFLVSGILGGLLYGYIKAAVPISADLVTQNIETTHIKDCTGFDIALLTGSQNINREYVSFSSVKETYIDEAFKAIEDERFDEHIGIDPSRIGSAIISALSNGGNPTHGGSTITQQTIKMLSGANKRSAQRKIQEWYNAIQLEQNLSKNEIMEIYLNLVPMANSYVGIQAAAQAYFDKDAKDLSLIECAFLAGIPNRPAVYNPQTETGRRNALRRMRIVLGKMHDLNWISDVDYIDSLNQELVFRQTPPSVLSNQINSYFVDHVIEEVIQDLTEKNGYSHEMAAFAVYNLGLTIETTVDSGVQAKVEKVFNTQTLFAQDLSILNELLDGPQGSIVVIENDPNPGQIKAIVGGYGDKSGNFVLNRATNSHRQPGSSIKPLAVYGPAIDMGKISAASIFSDMPVFLSSEDPTALYPRNSYAGYKGNMSVRNAVKISCNTIAAQIWKNTLRGETSLTYLAKVGIERPTENYVAIALGAFNQGMSALEMAGGYATFANEGTYTKPYSYTRVLDTAGKVLLEQRPQQATVYKPETAFVMTDILSAVFAPGGTAAGHSPTNTIAAGKTGTTDDNQDKWFCGYTPYYTAAVWYGYDNRLSGNVIPKQDRGNAILIWQATMQSLHETLPPKAFSVPQSIDIALICPVSGQLANSACPNAYNEYLVPGASVNPRDYCYFHLDYPELFPFEPLETQPDETGQPVETSPSAEAAFPAETNPHVKIKRKH